MWYTIIKILISAILIGIISEVSRRNSFVGGILVSIPLTSLLAFIWLYVDTQDKGKIIALSNSIFWLVIPSLSFFVVFPMLLKKLDFGISMVLSLAIMLGFYYTTVYVLSKFNIYL